MTEPAQNALESARSKRRGMYMQSPRLRPAPRGPGMGCARPSTRGEKLAQLRTELSIVTDRHRSNIRSSARSSERDIAVVSSIKAELLILAGEDGYPQTVAEAQQLLVELDTEFDSVDPDPGAGLAVTKRFAPGWQDDLEVLMASNTSEALFSDVPTPEPLPDTGAVGAAGRGRREALLRHRAAGKTPTEAAIIEGVSRSWAARVYRDAA